MLWSYPYMDYYYKSPIGRKAIKLHTVNVLEFFQTEFQASWSFSDSPEGNRRAIRKFLQMVRKHSDSPLSKEDTQSILDEGTFSDAQEYYQLYLTHSL